jgi:hypothetical protein
MYLRRVLMSVMAVAMLMCARPAVAQQIIQTGPPPELRKNLDAYQKAFNSGSADEYEAMAKVTFTPEYLKRQTAEQRKAEYTKWHKAFGTIKFDRVERNGMDAPLEITVKGSVASGVMWIEIDDDTSKLVGVKANASSRH